MNDDNETVRRTTPADRALEIAKDLRERFGAKARIDLALKIGKATPLIGVSADAAGDPIDDGAARAILTIADRLEIAPSCGVNAVTAHIGDVQITALMSRELFASLISSAAGLGAAPRVLAAGRAIQKKYPKLYVTPLLELDGSGTLSVTVDEKDGEHVFRGLMAMGPRRRGGECNHVATWQVTLEGEIAMDVRAPCGWKPEAPPPTGIVLPVLAAEKTS